jgi:hypothetical protein
MTIDQVRRDEEPAALDGSCNHLDDIVRPWAVMQPSLRGGIAKIEMYPGKVHNLCRGIDFYEGALRMPKPVTERKGKQWTTVRYALSDRQLY